MAQIPGNQTKYLLLTCNINCTGSDFIAVEFENEWVQGSTATLLRSSFEG